MLLIRKLSLTYIGHLSFLLRLLLRKLDVAILLSNAKIFKRLGLLKREELLTKYFNSGKSPLFVLILLEIMLKLWPMPLQP